MFNHLPPKQAKMLVPALPEVDMAIVGSMRPGIVFTGGMMTDILRKRKVQEALHNVEKMKHQTHRAMAWLNSKM